MRVTAQEMMRATGGQPVDILDNNGQVIYRAITAVDFAAGWVESYICRRDGTAWVVGGEILRREELFPAPLRFMRISPEQVERNKGKLWDLLPQRPPVGRLIKMPPLPTVKGAPPPRVPGYGDDVLVVPGG